MPKTKSQLKEWQHAKIKDFGRVVTGKTPPTKNQEYYGDRYPFITPTDISDNSIYVVPKRYLSEKGAQKVLSSKIPKNSVCYTCIASVGKIVITKEESFTNQQINSVVADSSKADYRYVFYLLRNMTPQIKGMVGGAASPIINKSAFEDIGIDIPDLPTQKQIADVLSAYDDLIENNTRRIKILEELAQAIYKEWFVYFRFPGHEKVKMVDSKTEFGKIPEGWKIGKLEDVGELIKQPYTDRDKNLPLVDMSRMQSGTLAINEVGKSSDLSTSRIVFSKDDLLFGSIRTYLHKIVLAPFAGITNTSVFVIKSKAIHFKAFLDISVFRKEAIDWTNQYSTGTKMPVIKWKAMRGMPIVIPANPILENFQNSVWPMLEKIQDFYYINAKLRQARDLLLPKLVTGDIEIKK